MSTGWAAFTCGLLVTSAILLAALVVSAPDATTLLLAIAIGAVVAVSMYLRDRRG